MSQAIMNDGRQQMVHVWQKLFFDSRIVATDNINPDYVKLAQAYDIEAFSCEVCIRRRLRHLLSKSWACALSRGEFYSIRDADL